MIPGKGLNTSLYIGTKRSNNKQNSRFSITDITNQGFNKLLKKFINLPYLGCNSKQVRNEPTEAYFSLTEQITKIIKIKRNI